MLAETPNYVLIPCHNNAALLQDCLESVLAQDIGNIRILAINNGSQDNVSRVLAGLEHQHITINAYPQLGVAGAWNYGLKQIFTNGSGPRELYDSRAVGKLEQKVLVVNQDVILRPETYSRLNDESGEFVTAVSTDNISKLWDADISTEGRRPHPDFSCFRITRTCFERTGPFDESFYPAWFEDNDYHIRMSASGIEAYCIDLPFYHYAAGTMKTASEYDKANYYNPGFLKSKERFQKKWGVLPGTKEYEELCQTK